MARALVIGAGVGGLAAAIELAREGIEVTVLEAHTYPGGSAGRFFHKGFYFDAGATLLAGFEQGGVFNRLLRSSHQTLEATRLPQGFPLMQVTLPNGQIVERPIGRQQEFNHQTEAFGHRVRPFWQWQAQRAEALWSIADQLPFPPASWREARRLLGAGLPWALQQGLRLPGTVADLWQPTARRAPALPLFQRFLDAQLLIASQADASHTYGLFGAAALDLPHRDPVLLAGGVGRLPQLLAQLLEQLGSRVLYRHRVESLEVRGSRVVAAQVVLGGRRRGEVERFEADLVIANLTPNDLAPLLGHKRPSHPPRDGWGAFMLHAALPTGAVPPGAPFRQWAGQGDWAFVSVAPPSDTQRGPAGYQVVSASIHTPLSAWRGLDATSYLRQKDLWTQRALQSVEPLIPGFYREAAVFMAASPRTYAFYTRRQDGWVGGYPQTHPLRTPSPATGFSNLWRAGETVFPGQSVPAVAMGGQRVARLALEQF
jgi:phytoene dehydrogenase-like protein